LITETITKLTEGRNLGRDEARRTVTEILGGDVSDAAISGLLIALKMKGETCEEITGFAEGMRQLAVPVRPGPVDLVDTCGTGGDRKGTFNISTAAGFIAAASGVTVAKHGNRSVSSRCGSADVLEEMGVDISMGPEMVRECIDTVGIAFLFAPTFHPAMRRVVEARKSLGVPTVFNVLGPLANPAGARAQVLGVSRSELAPLVGEALIGLGTDRAFVVHGSDGMDEFTLAGETDVCEVAGGRFSRYTVAPEDLGLARCRPGDLEGGDAKLNASIVRDVLRGAEGPRLDISVANAAFAVVAGGKAASLEDGVRLAREAVESGEAARRLQEMVEFSRDKRRRDVSG
jgi:anthranilate phosphoribosyltransferase